VPRNLTVRQRFKLEGIDSEENLFALDFTRDILCYILLCFYCIILNEKKAEISYIVILE
jgi:hypothetical protein